MADEKAPALTEPVIVQCLFCTGVDVQHTENFTRLIGWVELPAPGYDFQERRIIARMVMPPEIARALSRDLRRSISRGDH
ncbi:hypothetical protein [Mesorhizobium ciceri]|uniref:hypothetical protein n=1 Tax=Mesorhizobium TaxID=68287 RepID=UPI00047B3200|nr:hypothetical protein [Mesorhizobium ciceri]